MIRFLRLFVFSKGKNKYPIKLLDHMEKNFNFECCLYSMSYFILFTILKLKKYG